MGGGDTRYEAEAGSWLVDEGKEGAMRCQGETRDQKLGKTTNTARRHNRHRRHHHHRRQEQDTNAQATP